jgi:arylsulfatase A-like enzyme
MKKYILLLLVFAAMIKFLKAQPNIVLIISDDHAYQAISAYGGSLPGTPNIDRIATQGALFNKAYVTNSICGPSRACILTGKYSHINGFRDNENSTFDFRQDNFAKRLQRAGYQTAWIGKMHLGNNPPEGFNYYNILPDQGQYYNPEFILPGNKTKQYTGYVTDVVTDVAQDWLEHRDKSKPFCLVIGHKATHRTWMPALEDLGRYDSLQFKLPDDFYDTYDTRKAAAIQDMTIAKTMRLAHDLKIYEPNDSLAIENSVSRMTKEQKEKWFAYYAQVMADFDAKKHSGNDLTEWKY